MSKSHLATKLMNGLLLLAHLAWAYPSCDSMVLGDNEVCIVRNFQKRIVPPGQILDWTATNLVFEFKQMPEVTKSNDTWIVTLREHGNFVVMGTITNDTLWLTNVSNEIVSPTNFSYFIFPSCAHQWDYRVEYADGGHLIRRCAKCKKCEEPVWH